MEDFNDRLYKITVAPEGKVVFCPPGKDLWTALTEEGIWVDGACGGAGTCGKCKIEILSGTSPPLTDSEGRLLSEEERVRRRRLACRVVPVGDMAVDAGAPKKRVTWTREAVSGVSGTYGLAVDVGTTTVEAALVDKTTGKFLAGQSEINPQTRFGMDVLSRISYVMGHSDGTDLLQKTIVNLLDRMAEDLCRRAGVSPSSIDAVAVAANCTMLHLLLGVNPASLGTFPFTPVFLQGRDLLAGEIGLKTAGKNARLYCLPSV